MSTIGEPELDAHEGDPAEPGQSEKERRRRAGFVGLAIGLAGGFILATALTALTQQEPPLDLGTRWDEGWPIEVGASEGGTFWAGTEKDGTRTCVRVTGDGPAAGAHGCVDTGEMDGTAKFGHTLTDQATGITTAVTYTVTLRGDRSFTFTVESEKYLEGADD